MKAIATMLEQNPLLSPGRRSAEGGGPRRQRGLSIVELMVALTIGLIIVIAVERIFVTSSGTFRATEGLSRAQETGRFAIEFMSRDIRMAGNLGCIRDTLIIDNLNTGGSPYDFGRGIQGFEYAGTAPGNTYTISSENPTNTTGGWAPALDTALVPPGAIPGSDVLVIRRMDGRPLRRATPINDSAMVFLDSSESVNIRDGDILAITDCDKTSVFQVTSTTVAGPRLNVVHAASGTPGNRCPVWAPPACPEQEYGNSAEVSKLLTVAYFIGRGASGEPALFMAMLQPGGAGTAMVSSEMLEGVESMQILYGLDQDNDGSAETYMTADQVEALTVANPDTGWPQVLSVRLSLLVRSTHVKGTAARAELDTNTYLLAGSTAATATTIDPFDDKRRRRVFNATIQLRSRGL